MLSRAEAQQAEKQHRLAVERYRKQPPLAVFPVGKIWAKEKTNEKTFRDAVLIGQDVDGEPLEVVARKIVIDDGTAKIFQFQTFHHKKSLMIAEGRNTSAELNRSGKITVRGPMSFVWTREVGE